VQIRNDPELGLLDNQVDEKRAFRSVEELYSAAAQERFADDTPK
jgi:hypothetical protein